MFTAADYDPVFLREARRSHPHLWPNHRRLVQLADADDRHRLEELDAELDVLCAKRLRLLARLATSRDRLWPRSEHRHVRRRGSLGTAPCPPAAADAIPVNGIGLRHVIVALVRRHGPLPLRELHGLVHRYGYVIESDRPVQRLGDAAGYEVRQGRLVRHGRGVYGPTPCDADIPPGADLPDDITRLADEPLAWSAPHDGETPVVDPTISTDPERWSDQRWPASAQVGSTVCPPPVAPGARRAANELHQTVMAARERLADVIARRQGPPPPRMGADSSRPPRNPPPDANQPLGDDSSTNRRQRNRTDEWLWGALPDDEVVEEWPDEPPAGDAGGSPPE